MGLLQCGKCKECPLMKKVDYFLPNGKFHKVKQNIGCETMGIINLLTCECGCFYIGKTKRQFRRRIGDHLGDIRGGRMNKPICRHVGLFHKFDASVIKFCASEVVSEPSRGGDWDNLILQKEAR